MAVNGPPDGKERRSSSESIYQQVGILQGEMRSVQAEVHTIRKDVHEILETVNKAKGGWKAIIVLSSVAGFASGALFKLLSILPIK